jgi:hypothetical protein
MAPCDRAAPLRSSHVAAAGMSALVGAACWWAWTFDVFAAGAPTSRRVLVVAIVAAPAAALAVLAFVARMPRWVAALSCAAFAGTILLPFVSWHPRKRFARDLHSLRGGMKADEVEQVMGRWIRGPGAKWSVPGVPAASVVRPGGDAGGAGVVGGADGAVIYRWDDADYDSDWGRVEFADGRVVRVEFLPD